MGFNILCVLSLLLSVYFILISSDVHQDHSHWELFKMSYNKSYKNLNDEHIHRIRFSSVHKFIIDHNSNQKGFRLRVYRHSDRTKEEMKRTRFGLKPKDRSKTKRSETLLRTINMKTVPESWDWRDVNGINLVTEPRDQGSCGCCYAFSASSVMESQSMIVNHIHNITTPQYCVRSRQNLVDCSSIYGNSGCDGGDMDTCFEYVIKNKGINGENKYPYEDRVGSCRYNKSCNLGTISSYTPNNDIDEETLKSLLYFYGPISCGIEATDYFANYCCGVLDDPTCSSDPMDMNHAVTLVGYGKTIDGTQFWIVKNSWGPHWGEGGYIRMSRNADNQCGIATMPTFICMAGSKTTDQWFHYSNYSNVTL